MPFLAPPSPYRFCALAPVVQAVVCATAVRVCVLFCGKSSCVFAAFALGWSAFTPTAARSLRGAYGERCFSVYTSDCVDGLRRSCRPQKQSRKRANSSAARIDDQMCVECTKTRTMSWSWPFAGAHSAAHLGWAERHAEGTKDETNKINAQASIRSSNRETKHFVPCMWFDTVMLCVCMWCFCIASVASTTHT